MKPRQFLICLCLTLSSILVHAQYYNTGQDPASLKWMQIKTERFRIIYPESYERGGEEFARSLDQSFSELSSLYSVKKFRLPVIIHNYTTFSNGYVAWAPSRMEIYPTPEQNAIALDPNRQLTLHELTHLIQMETLCSGFTKALSYPFGQQFPGIVSSLLPLWFLEGDAVFSESILTGSGRGRTPSFQKQLKAIVVEKGNMFKYDKTINGSFRDFVPDHYESGFQIMAWSYTKYGTSLWRKALEFTGRDPFTINPVNLSLNLNASTSKKKLFRETFDSLNIIWSSADSKISRQSYEIINAPKNKKYINYYSPVIAGRDSIIAVKTSLADPPRLVLIKPSDRSERKIRNTGNLYPWFISFAKSKLVWVETQRDPRWENRSYSVIKILDLKTNYIRRLSGKTRYMSASISPDGNFIAATENSVENNNRLIIIDAWNGDILQKIDVPGNIYLQRPQWDGTGKKITFISLTEVGEGIVSFDTENKSWKVLIEPDRNDLQSSFLRNDSLFFISSRSGTDNLYLLKPDGSQAALTDSRFGAGDFSLNGSSILFVDYTSDGNNICKTKLPLAGREFTLLPDSASFLINRFGSIYSQETGTGERDYSPEPYRKWKHMFRFHSWMPFYADIEQIQSDPASIRPGLTIMTQNDLSTLTSTFGYEYSDSKHKIHTVIDWNGWYFLNQIRLDYGNVPLVEKPGSATNVGDPTALNPGYDFQYTLSLPLLFQSGRFSQYFFLSASSTVQNNYIYIREKQVYDTRQTQLTGRIYFSNYGKSAIRDIYPRWAQVLDLSHSFYPFNKDIYGPITTVRSAFYFPGLFKNHGLRVRLESEKQEPVKFILSNRTSFSRGYDNIISEQLNFLSADYYMPLFYPDFNLSSLLYITRIRTNLFLDNTIGTGNYIFSSSNIFSGNSEDGKPEVHDYQEVFRSFGFELVSDFYLFRMPFLITSGIQASWLDIREAPYVRLLFNINLFGLNIGKGRI
jgi:hypothetical protein